MKKLLLSIFAIVSLMVAPHASALTLDNEVLNYQVVYHWGVVWKHAGDANLSLHKTGSGYNAKLTAKTRSWADKIFTLRDTLKCSMNTGFKPIKYEKFTHEGSYSDHDIVTFSHTSSGTSAKCMHKRKDRPADNVTLSTSGAAYDMLSMFYMLRNLDFDKMAADKVYKSCVFSGRQKETLTIKYVGIKPLQLRDKSRHQAFHLKLTFTKDGGKKSSDDIDAYISTDAKRIPLLVVGKLSIGEIKCFYTK